MKTYMYVCVDVASMRRYCGRTQSNMYTCVQEMFRFFPLFPQYGMSRTGNMYIYSEHRYCSDSETYLIQSKSIFTPSKNTILYT